MVTETVVASSAEQVVAVVANCAAVIKQAPCAVVVAAMVSIEHCENSGELAPNETDEYIRNPFFTALQVGRIELMIVVCACANCTRRLGVRRK